MKKSKIVGAITPATIEAIKKMPYLISIPRITPPNGVLLRMHWTKRRKLRETFGLELMAATDWRVPKVEEKEKRKVKIVSHRISLIRDDDNFYGGLKPLLDALTGRRIIYDDSRKYIELTLEQKRVKDKEDQKTDIFIYLGEARQ